MPVNLKGAFCVARAAARKMDQIRGRDARINHQYVSTIAEVAIHSQANFNSQKVRQQLTKVMALSLASRGIRVNAIGPVPSNRYFWRGDNEARKQESDSVTTPMRAYCEAFRDAFNAAFCINEPSYITGQDHYADGGRLALIIRVPVGETEVFAGASAVLDHLRLCSAICHMP